MSSMLADARLATVAVAQHGVFTREQATAAGFSPSQIERRVRRAVWVRVLPRVYRHGSTPASGALAHWAAVLWAGPGAALSHAGAAAVWGIHRPAVVVPEVIVPRDRAPRAAGVVVHRVTRIDAVDLVRVRGLPITSPVRTIIDLAAVVDAGDLAGALERARSRGLVTVRAVGRRLDEIGTGGRPGSARLRALLGVTGSARVDPSARMAG